MNPLYGGKVTDAPKLTGSSYGIYYGYTTLYGYGIYGT